MLASSAGAAEEAGAGSGAAAGGAGGPATMLRSTRVPGAGKRKAASSIATFASICCALKCHVRGPPFAPESAANAIQTPATCS